MNLHIVEPVPGEAVDLVHDAEVDLVRCDVLQHPLQIGPVSRACRFASVDELGYDPSTQRFGFAGVRLALCRDREPLVPSALGGLPFCREPLIGHCHQHRQTRFRSRAMSDIIVVLLTRTTIKRAIESSSFRRLPVTMSLVSPGVETSAMCSTSATTSACGQAPSAAKLGRDRRPVLVVR